MTLMGSLLFHSPVFLDSGRTLWQLDHPTPQAARVMERFHTFRTTIKGAGMTGLVSCKDYFNGVMIGILRSYEVGIITPFGGWFGGFMVSSFSIVERRRRQGFERDWARMRGNIYG
jgi:hypothetical protein